MHKAKITLAAQDFDFARSALHTVRKEVFENWRTSSGEEKAFYSKRIDEYDTLLTRFENALNGDTSEDPTPDEDETEED